ncbi:MAG: TIGR00282 family metallophosphoesterase [Mycoplasmataceae bacterium]|nr:TIGR00282 family metallophosphoesterase [Mycoplasmataceae bacterium]
MNILFIGDIFGKSGIETVKAELPSLIHEYNVDLVIANAENASINGKGLNKNDYNKLQDTGINFFTLGNHAFRNSDILKYIDHVDNLVRPYNWEGDSIPGVGTQVIEKNGKKVRITSLLGQSFINEPSTNPFSAIEEILADSEQDIHIVDFHGETTSEKNVFGYKMDGKVDAIFGTHTHVQTNDLRLNPKGTLYMTDVGMTGPQYSAIGAELESVAKRMITGMPSYFKESTKSAQFNGIVFKINDKTNKIENFEKIFISPENPLDKFRENE